MDISQWIEHSGTHAVLATGGAVVGLGFGFLAQRSRFCLRAATIEFWRGQFGEKLAIWLLAFSSAVVSVQVAVLAGWLDVSTARQIATRGSLSGALIGGAIFGAGMILTRGCASRLLVLSANGNLRALLSGLIFAVTAQASLSGALSPLREALSRGWTVEGGPTRDLLAILGLGHWGGLVVGLLWLAAALYFTLRATRSRWTWLGGIGTGLMVTAAWLWTSLVARQSFDVVNLQGLTFSGPSAEWLMRVLQSPAPAFAFDAGMLPAVFAGSLIGALLGGEWKLEGFGDGYSMRRYIVGAVLMGFGAMLAGGCAVGAGVTGGAIFALTAWLTLLGMWGGAGLADWLIDRRVTEQTGRLSTAQIAPGVPAP